MQREEEGRRGDREINKGKVRNGDKLRYTLQRRHKKGGEKGLDIRLHVLLAGWEGQTDDRIQMTCKLVVNH